MNWRIDSIGWAVAKADGWTRSLARLCMAAAFATASIAPHAYAVVVADDFSDGNDTANPAWTHLNGAVGTTGQTWTVSEGKYRLYSPTATSQGSMDPNFAGYDFIGSYTGPSFTDVRVSADFVDFPIGPIEKSPVQLPSWFGVAARWNGNNDPPNPLPGQEGHDPSKLPGIQLNGYSYHFESNANNGNGEMVLGFLWNGGLKDIGSQKVNLDPAQDYRIVLEVLGDVLHGQVFHLDGTPSGTLVAEDFRDVVNEPVVDNHDLDPGTPNQPLEPLESGFSGVFAVGHVFLFEPDFTIENFRTETAVPGDYNRNGVVDAADYVLWRKTLGQTGPVNNPPLPEDFVNLQANGAVTNGYTQTIDEVDYQFWVANFGKSVGGGLAAGTAVPEPASAALVLLAGGLYFSSRHHRAVT